MKTRKEMADYVQSFAIIQFHKKFTFNKMMIRNHKNKNFSSYIKLVKVIPFFIIIFSQSLFKF
jgi:hypothetical protein